MAEPEPPPRDIPSIANWAVIRSVGELLQWHGYVWRWDGHKWQRMTGPNLTLPAE